MVKKKTQLKRWSCGRRFIQVKLYKINIETTVRNIYQVSKFTIVGTFDKGTSNIGILLKACIELSNSNSNHSVIDCIIYKNYTFNADQAT